MMDIYLIILWIWTLIFWCLLIINHFKNNDTAKALIVAQVLITTPILAFLGFIFKAWVIGTTYFVLWSMMLIQHYFYKKKKRRLLKEAKQDIRRLYREIGQKYPEDD